MKSILLVSYILLLVITAARGKSADEWKSRVIYQVFDVVVCDVCAYIDSMYLSRGV